MSRDFWNTKRLAPRVDKIKKSLTIPAGDYDCCFTRASVYNPTTVSALRLQSNITLSATQLTIDYWAKYSITPLGINVDAFSLIDSSGVASIRMNLRSSTTVMTIVTSLGTYTFTVLRSFYYEWHRFTVTFSVTDNELRLYVDEVLMGAVTTTGNLINNDFAFNLGQAAFLGQAIGFVNELALYATRKTQEAIIQIKSFKANIGAYGTNLQGYWKLNNFAAGISSPSVGSIDIISASATLDTTEYAPVKFGSSFVVAQHNVTLTHKCSLRFPETPPDETTGMLVVRWVDDNEVTQRRKLWDLDGVDIGPPPATYNGEPIAETFSIELWNIDGQETCVIPEEIVLRISKTTDPTNSHDDTSVSAAVITADSTLAEAFSLTLPATFNSQQTYP